jgi:hypothetical protein
VRFNTQVTTLSYHSINWVSGSSLNIPANTGQLTSGPLCICVCGYWNLLTDNSKQKIMDVAESKNSPCDIFCAFAWKQRAHKVNLGKKLNASALKALYASGSSHLKNFHSIRNSILSSPNRIPEWSYDVCNFTRASLYYLAEGMLLVKLQYTLKIFIRTLYIRDKL